MYLSFTHLFQVTRIKGYNIGTNFSVVGEKHPLKRNNDEKNHLKIKKIHVRIVARLRKNQRKTEIHRVSWYELILRMTIPHLRTRSFGYLSTAHLLTSYVDYDCAVEIVMAKMNQSVIVCTMYGENNFFFSFLAENKSNSKRQNLNVELIVKICRYRYTFTVQWNRFQVKVNSCTCRNV